MNVLEPIRTIMTTNLITVNPKDKLTAVKEVFEKNKIHHIPVVRFREIVGMISKTDFLHFLRGFKRSDEDRFVDNARLRVYTAEDIMTTGLAKVGPDERIGVALEIFLENRFHAIPIIEGDELIGIVTTFDILKKLASEKVTPEQILEARSKSKKD
jgi:acetoin utilization protein AcuB